jgi:hypothetical protein
VALLLGFGGFASQPVFSPAGRTVSAAAPAGTMFADARELAVRYRRDSAAADNLFKGRRITLSGRVERVGDNHIAMAAAVNCSLGRTTTADERTILPGTPVTVRGAVAGSPAKGPIEISACELLPEAD